MTALRTISVVICTYNRADSMRRTLESLTKLSVPPELQWELIVVDNNSTDSTREVVEAFAAGTALNLRYVFEGKQGLSHARNAGLNNARGEIIAFTDDDVTVHGNWIQAIHTAFAQFNCTGIAGKTVAVWPCERPSWYEDKGPYALDSVITSFDLGDNAFEMARCPVGANMAFRKTAFEKYGLFRTDLGRTGKDLLGGEDTEFGRRLLKGGEKLVYWPEAVVHHPVEEDRLSKKYFQSWYFGEGRHWMREFPPTRGTVQYFGAPRHLYRSFAEDLMKWMFSMNRRRRFYHKLALYRRAGQIAEARDLSSEAKQCKE